MHSTDRSLDEHLQSHMLPSWLPALALGVVIALTLTWGMKALIASPKQAQMSPRYGDVLDFVRVKPKPQEVRTKSRPAQPEKPQTPPPPPAIPDMQIEAPPLAKLSAEMPDITPDIKLDGLGFNLGEMQAGEYLPLAKIAPHYPQRALQKRLQGNCTVEYTVASDGRTKDIRVVEGLCDSWMFNKPSIEAAQRFRYQPRKVDGQAVEVPGVRNEFKFRIQ